MRKVPLLIVGAGPKGVALGAKHHALASTNDVKSDYLIVERHDVGAHWTGTQGYTDGEQRLVSPPEQDLGYPYKSFRTWQKGSEIDREMQRLSWESFLVAKRLRDDWVINHKERPTHRRFVEYLQWAATDAKLKEITADVTEIGLLDKQWLTSWDGEPCQSAGLVITSHGGPKRIGGKGEENPRILDGKDFWLKRDIFKEIKPGNLIAVVGAGETAGAIALAILDIIQANASEMIQGPVKPEIMLICKQPGYSLRSDVAKDLRYFSDPVEWADPNSKVAQRLGIIRRADRGVVSKHVKDRLEQSDLVSYHVGKLNWAKGYSPPKAGRFEAVLTYGLEAETRESVSQPLDFLVSALGFDDVWFLRLFTLEVQVKLISHILKTEKRVTIDALKKLLDDEGKTIADVEQPEVLAKNIREPVVSSWLQKKLEFTIGFDLSVEGFEPKLHLPRLAGLMQGPGLPNLNCLGLLSDRIWSAYESHLKI